MSPSSPLYAVHTTGWGLAWRPALPPWLLAIGLILAVALVVHLYRAQRALAPVWTIRWLTLLRLALVALLIVLLADPVLRWVRVVDSPGQLWLVLDGSQSMAFKDPQAGAVERLRWACALGLIPKDLFSDAWDRDAARLLLLREQLRRYRTLSRRLASRLTRRGPSRALLRDLRVWLRRLRAATGRLGAAAPLAPARSALAELAATTVSAINGWQNGQPPPFSSLLAALNLALRRLAAAARDRDQLFLAAHEAQGNVRLALNRVASMSRSDLAVALLTGRGPAARRAGALAALVRRKRVRLVRFAGKGMVLPPLPRAALSDRISDALRPAGNATNIAAAITAVARHVSPRRAATVLLVSDGRQNVGPDPSPLARWLAERGVRTYAICLGSDRSPPTLSIQALQAPHWIFQAQRVKAVALVHLRQLKGKTITVQFWRGGKLLHTRLLTATRGDQLQRVTFTNRPPGAGIYHYALRIPPVAGTFNPHVVQRRFNVAVRRDKLQVLYIAADPTWQYQYLVDVLSRSPRVHLQALLLHPARIAGVKPPAPVRASPQNRGYVVQKMPATPTAWAAYDVIILGDVAPDAFTAMDLQGLAAAVRNHGAALVVLAGPNHMPGQWRHTPLQSLLPVKLSRPGATPMLALQDRTGFVPILTPEGVNAPLSQLALDSRNNGTLWRDMPHWYWHSPYTQARSVARVLWSMESSSAAAGGASFGSFSRARRRALLATLAVGAGRVLYLAGEGTWRMRYVDGRNIEDNFWAQVLRWAVGVQLPAGGKYIRFGTNQSTFTPGQTVHVRARVLQDNLLPQTGLHFRVLAAAAAAGHPAGLPAQVVRSYAAMRATPGSPGYYEGDLAGLRPGTYTITLQGDGVRRRLKNDPTAVVRALTVRVRPQPDLELSDPRSDPKALARLAEAGAGLMLPGPFANLLARRIPTLTRPLRLPEQTGFFVHPHRAVTRALHVSFLLVFVLLITLEWLLRKRANLI